LARYRELQYFGHLDCGGCTWLTGSVLLSINEVTPRQAWIVPYLGILTSHPD